MLCKRRKVEVLALLWIQQRLAQPRVKTEKESTPGSVGIPAMVLPSRDLIPCWRQVSTKTDNGWSWRFEPCCLAVTLGNRGLSRTKSYSARRATSDDDGHYVYAIALDRGGEELD